MDSKRLTVTDYVVRADGSVLGAKPTLREARLYVKSLGRAGGPLPEVVELIKRTTTQTVLNIYTPQPMETLVSVNSLDEGLE